MAAKKYLVHVFYVFVRLKQCLVSSARQRLSWSGHGPVLFSSAL